jgi:hypothetical protein
MNAGVEYAKRCVRACAVGVLRIAVMSEANKKPTNLASVIAVSLVLTGIVFLVWVTNGTEDERGGVSEPQAAGEHSGKSKQEQERFAAAFNQLDLVTAGGKLQDVCEGAFRWLGGGDPMCMVVHDVGFTRYEVHDTGDQAWFAMSFYYGDRAARTVAFNDIWDYIRMRDPNATRDGDRFNFTHDGQEGFCDLAQTGHTDVLCKVRLR